MTGYRCMCTVSTIGRNAFGFVDMPYSLNPNLMKKTLKGSWKKLRNSDMYRGQTKTVFSLNTLAHHYWNNKTQTSWLCAEPTFKSDKTLQVIAPDLFGKWEIAGNIIVNEINDEIENSWEEPKHVRKMPRMPTLTSLFMFDFFTGSVTSISSSVSPPSKSLYSLVPCLLLVPNRIAFRYRIIPGFRTLYRERSIKVVCFRCFLKTCHLVASSI